METCEILLTISAIANVIFGVWWWVADERVRRLEKKNKELMRERMSGLNHELVYPKDYEH